MLNVVSACKCRLNAAKLSFQGETEISPDFFFHRLLGKSVFTRRYRSEGHVKAEGVFVGARVLAVVHCRVEARDRDVLNLKLCFIFVIVCVWVCLKPEVVGGCEWKYMYACSDSVLAKALS